MQTRPGSRQAVLLLLLLSFTSCALVKEDRTRCPCRLRVLLEGLPAHPVDLTLEGESFQESFRVGRDTCLQLWVPKSGVHWQASAGAGAGEDGVFHIPYGFDCPPLYLGGGTVDTACDTASVAISLHKHFCMLQLEVESPPGWGEPYWAEIRGPVEGVQADGTPLEGRFSCRLEPGIPARLPRQDPSAPLWLDITLPDRVVRSFSLDSYLLQAGYDWTAPDLEDCSLTLRLSVTRLFFQVDAFSVEVPWEIDI